MNSKLDGLNRIADKMEVKLNVLVMLLQKRTSDSIFHFYSK